MTQRHIAAPWVLCLLLVSCRGPVEPTAPATLDRFVKALREQGLTVSLDGQIAPNVIGFFSVPAERVRVNDSQLNAFVYQTADAAAAEAALISPDGQPTPTARVIWLSTPRFYRDGAMIVMYVGCMADILQALEKTVGPPIVVGTTGCIPVR